MCVTQLVARPSVMSNEYAPLIQTIKDYLNLEWQVSISHIYREANFAADYMVNLTFSIPLAFIVYPTPPLILGPFYFMTHMGSLIPALLLFSSFRALVYQKKKNSKLFFLHHFTNKSKIILLLKHKQSKALSVKALATKAS